MTMPINGNLLGNNSKGICLEIHPVDFPNRLFCCKCYVWSLRERILQAGQKAIFLLSHQGRESRFKLPVQGLGRHILPQGVTFLSDKHKTVIRVKHGPVWCSDCSGKP
jgi:hypothetical protein